MRSSHLWPQVELTKGAGSPPTAEGRHLSWGTAPYNLPTPLRPDCHGALPASEMQELLSSDQEEIEPEVR